MPLAYSIRVESVHEENATRRFLLFPPPKKTIPARYYVAKDRIERGEIVDGR